MERYFFDCFNGKHFWPDLHGIELSSLDEVADQAASLTRELLNETTESVGSLCVSVMVHTLDGAHVYVAHCGFHAVRMSEAAEILPRKGELTVECEAPCSS